MKSWFLNLVNKTKHALPLPNSSTNVNNTYNMNWHVASIIFLWYTCSTVLSLFNKKLFAHELDNFHYPLLLSSFQSLFHIVLAHSLLKYSRVPCDKATNGHLFIKYLLPTALLTAFDISLSNISLQSISLSNYVMIKSSTPIWIWLFSILLGLEKFELNILGCVIVICAGVMTTIYGEREFDAIDIKSLTLILLASWASGFRWSLTQLLIKHSPYENNPVGILYMLSPIMSILFAIGSFYTEIDTQEFLQFLSSFTTMEEANYFLLYVITGGSLAFLVVLMEFCLVSETSVLTLSVAGIFKETLLISCSMLFLNEKMNFLKAVGLGITIIGIGFYKLYRHSSSAEGLCLK